MIAIDLMSGDVGYENRVLSSVHALKRNADLQLIFVGNALVLDEAKKSIPHSLASRVRYELAEEQVSMNDDPAFALRKKPNSSMHVMARLVKDGHASGCVSAGNTGALMAISRYILKMIPNINRPALFSIFPTIKRSKATYMLDLGANVDSTPEHLEQFALMATYAYSGLSNNNKPAVYLLNIGHEEIKGNGLVRGTHRLLKDHPFINYQGYIESDQIFLGEADIVVCDGFVGNILLKSIEGTLSFIVSSSKLRAKKSWFMRLFNPFFFYTLRSLINNESYSGAVLLGLQGVVIKNHGQSTVSGFTESILLSKKLADYSLSKKIAQSCAKQQEEIAYV